MGNVGKTADMFYDRFDCNVWSKTCKKEAQVSMPRLHQESIDYFSANDMWYMDVSTMTYLGI